MNFTGALEEGIVSITFPVEVPPGSNWADIYVISPVEQIPLREWSSEQGLLIEGDSSGIVAVVDTKGEFGWFALWPDCLGGDFTAAVSSSAAFSDPNAASSTAAAILAAPPIFHPDRSQRDKVYAVLDWLPEYRYFTQLLKTHSAEGNPFSRPEVLDAYSAAVSAVIDELGAYEFADVPGIAGANIPAGQPSGSIRQLDHSRTRFVLRDDRLVPQWGDTIKSKATSWQGLLWKVDMSRYGYDVKRLWNETWAMIVGRLIST